jgi:hypothetical protein
VTAGAWSYVVTVWLPVTKIYNVRSYNTGPSLYITLFSPFTVSLNTLIAEGKNGTCRMLDTHTAALPAVQEAKERTVCAHAESLSENRLQLDAPQ